MSFMKFLPTENFIYKTKLREIEVIHRLQEIVVPERLFRLPPSHLASPTKLYEGIIRRNSFDIQKIRFGRRNMIPQINGAIKEGKEETIITIKIRLSVGVFIWFWAWIALSGTAGFILLCQFLFNKVEFHPSLFAPFGFMFLGYAIVMAVFKTHSIPAKKELKKILEADIIEL